jgi:hypothetical protein
MTTILMEGGKSVNSSEYQEADNVYVYPTSYSEVSRYVYIIQSEYSMLSNFFMLCSPAQQQLYTLA